MSFGFGIGDLIKVVELAKDLRRTFVDAPRQLNEISQEVRALSIVLDDVEISVSHHDLDSVQSSRLRELTSTCQLVLRDLDKMLAKYSDVGKSGGNLLGKSKRVWKRLSVEPGEIHELRSRITSVTVLLNTFISGLSSSAVLDISRDVGILRLDSDLKKRDDILQWISAINAARVLADLSSRKQPGTGQWFLGSNEYDSWITNPGTTLFCPGKPGAGKTMTSSIVIEDLITRFSGDPTVGIAYHFCDFRRSEEQTAYQILSSLLKQVIRNHESIPASVVELYEDHGRGSKRPMMEKIAETLQTICNGFNTTFIVIDALDEAPPGDRKHILSSLVRIQSNQRTNILATSRPIPDVRDYFKNDMCLEISAAPEDLNIYLEACIDQLPSFVQHNTALQTEIKSHISIAADGIFLLAALYIRSLDDKVTPKAIRTAVKAYQQQNVNLSNEDDKQKILHSAYEQTMERINRQKPGFASLAIRVLSWITLAKTPLFSSELQHALAVEFGEAELDEENMPAIDDMVSVCAGLVTIDQDGGVIRLIHFTVQEYLEKTQSVWFPDASLEIAKSCLSYISIDEFGKERRQRGVIPGSKRLELYPFYAYAARFWSSHLPLEDGSLDDMVFELFLNQAKSRAISQVIAPFGYINETDGLHLAAYFGRTKVVSSLIGKGYSVHSRDRSKKTPLIWAACGGHLPTVKLLMEKGAEVNLQGVKASYGITPLSAAVISGVVDVVQFLLESGADLEERDWHGSTPLMIAIEYEYESIVQTLLNQGADADATNVQGDPPIVAAMQQNNDCILRLLLENGAANHYVGETGSKACVEAISRGKDSATYILLSGETLLPNYLDETGRSALSWLAIRGNDKAAEALIADRRISLDQKDFYGSTPLSLATRHGHERMVKLLLAIKDIDVESVDHFGRTPLSFALLHGYNGIVSMLAERAEMHETSRTTPEVPLFATRSWSEMQCDVCSLWIQASQPFVTCETCRSNDFDICLGCYNLGARCLDNRHQLKKHDGDTVSDVYSLLRKDPPPYKN